MADHAPFPRLVKRAHGFYRSLWESSDPEIKRLFVELADSALPFGRLQQIANETGVPYKTLQDWRAKLIENPFYCPRYPQKGVSTRVSEEIEIEIAEWLRTEYIEKKRYCPASVVKTHIERAVRTKTGEDFTAGRTYVKKFMHRHRLSLRVPHVRRRTAPNDEKVAEFLLDMDVAFLQLPDNLIFNVDETCWRLINGPVKTLAVVGQEEVVVETACDPKSDITVIAAVSKAGDRLPLYILGKGTTKRCLEKYYRSPVLRKHFASHSIIFDYSPSGWSDREVMIRYLSWLRDFAGQRIIHVLWDVHASHRHGDVRQWAAQHDVGLTFIPPGQTGTWQPLDRRVFGDLKSRAQDLLNESVLNEAFEDHDMFRAISVLVKAWELLTSDAIRKAWNHFET